jgi:hypothetical protein
LVFALCERKNQNTAQNDPIYAITLPSAILPAAAWCLTISSVFRFCARRAQKRNTEKKKSTAAKTDAGHRVSCANEKRHFSSAIE